MADLLPGNERLIMRKLKGVVVALMLLQFVPVDASASFIPAHREQVLTAANTVSLKSKWMYALSKSKNELKRLEQGSMKRFFQYVRTLSPQVQVYLVNQWVNREIKYVQEDKGGDRWQSIGESLSLRSGDCEDFALAKYAMLSYLGHSVDNLLMVGGVTRQSKKHVVLYVRFGNDVLALDNLNRYVVRSNIHVRSFRPIYGFRDQVSRLYLYRVV